MESLRAAIAAILSFLTFYGGVFALVASTATVGIGLVASDRVIMRPELRLAAQAVHRALAVATIVFLITHIALETAAGRVRPVDSVVPFLAPGRTFYIGLGTLASDFIIVIAVTGFARARFTHGRLKPRVWRAIHAVAYLAWPLAIIHGLLAGRQPKPYVTWSYGICVIAVVVALLTRLAAGAYTRRATR
ncbi:ferric reductase-like transmembrane domain-containing protein [Trebonia sp.]|uniref:ferric reductase-like transmembrane domain-containing protein n=1 Tax=Trebonia sp. TaxID=2767075 RepID=UPI002609FB1A|nr:ferric reductase-like transmembrane domain-containing protein [Trebonia sp.]